MKNKITLISIFSLLLLSGCARYSAEPLGNISSTAMQTKTRLESDVFVVAQKFDRQECKKYLNSDVLGQGYQPLQLFIKNNSNSSYQFSTERLDIVCTSSETVAKKVHSSLGIKATAYGLSSLIFLPMIVPGVIDLVMSSRSNEALNEDFLSKAAGDHLIQPGAYLNKLIFVPKDEYQSIFNLSLLDIETGKLKDVKVVVN